MLIEPVFSEGQIPLSEYPRPQFRRDSYLPLNGQWDYAFSPSAEAPEKYDGKIVVPYSPESSLSGVGRQLRADEVLHYRRFFELPEGFNRGRVLINFGACDQCCKVLLNGREAGRHEGGYLPFTLDITELIEGGVNELCVIVTDDASSHIYGRGKQSYASGGIWYTAISGLWQSVWLESVPEVYLTGLKLFPDGLNSTLSLYCRTEGGEGLIDYAVYDGDRRIAFMRGVKSGQRCTLNVSECLPWSPESPQLYKIVIACGADRAESYFGLRSYTVAEREGKRCFCINGRPVFHSGLLDQGYWGEGIYTPSSNREMYDCLKGVKALGFNMLRKHIKVEPLLWYYYCDVLGILVWQDMLNGGAPYKKLRLNLGPFIDLRLNDGDYKSMGRDDALSRKQYMAEAEGTIDSLFNCVSLCLWTLFNEGWGQFDSLVVCGHMRALDPTRYFDHASGWQDMGGGDVCSRHVYFKKVRLKNDGRRVLALTEFGGYSFSEKGRKKAFSYRKFASAEDYMAALERLYTRQILPAVKEQGLAATVYTQLSDVEEEVNGIFTPDWRCKGPKETFRRINDSLYRAFGEVFGS